MVTLYSTHCPKCVILEKKMNMKNIEFNTVTDVDLMTQKGFTSLPMLEVDGGTLEFKDAIDWVNSMED